MSVIEHIQNIFKSKKKPPEDSMDMSSVGMPVDPLATGAMRARTMRAPVETTEEKDDGFAASRLVSPQTEAASAETPDLLKLPLLGNKTMAQHQRSLLMLLGLSVLVLAVVAYRALNQADTVAQQITATGQALMQSQRLAKSVSQALVGSPQAFPDVKESADVQAKTVRGLKKGDDSLRLSPVVDDLQPDVDKIVPFMVRAEKNAATVMGQQAILTQVGAALRTINRQSSDLLEIAETVS
jgi:twitching motility protein PilJ